MCHTTICVYMNTQSSIGFVIMDTTPTEMYTLSLHDALPILIEYSRGQITILDRPKLERLCCECYATQPFEFWPVQDRKSTRLNSSHVAISYAVLCLKKKKHLQHTHPD